MKVNFIVSGQNLLRAPNEQKIKLASHNKKTILRADFRTEEWKDKIIMALFTYKNRTWKKILGASPELDFNECYIPVEVMYPGTFSVTLYCDDRYVTLPYEVEVVDSGYTDKIENEDLTPSTLDQLNDLMKRYALICNTILQDCNKIREEISKEE